MPPVERERASQMTKELYSTKNKGDESSSSWTAEISVSKEGSSDQRNTSTYDVKVESISDLIKVLG